MFEAQRKKGSFNKQQLSYLMYGGKESFEAFQKMQSICSNDPILKYDPTFLDRSRSEMMTVYAKKLLKFHEHYPFDGSTSLDKLRVFTYPTPLSFHELMFIKTLENFCDQEQEKMFLQPTLKGEILGCYAQTELSHGSDVQGLLTTATYDIETQSFIINTPQTAATKWWIGELGLFCNHAAVFAQLIINGKRYGVHSFIVPIRDPKTLKVLDGIEVGDIGPKHNFQVKDNGYAIFRNVRIPRRNMLMKYHVVSKEGNYSIQGNEKIAYTTMLLTRLKFVVGFPDCLAKIVTIATRYSVIRKQFKDKNGQEISIMDYQTQQQKILPRIADLFAFIFVGQRVKSFCERLIQESKSGNFRKLNEAHVITSGIKAIMSFDLLKGAQIMRKSAGGHGFHFYNGMITLQNENTAALTGEGQFTILLVQVSRYLLKSLQNLSKGKPLDQSVQYFELIKSGELSIKIENEAALDCPYLLEKVFALHSCGKIMAASQKFGKLMQEGLTFKQIEDYHAGILLNDAAVAHCYYLLYSAFLKRLETITDLGIKNVLTKLLFLYGTDKIIERAGKFYETATINPEAFGLLHKKKQAMLEALRPEALSLVQAFGYDDSSLMSAIGASNGRPYENLIQWAEKYNKLNQKEERDEIIRTIRNTKSQLMPRL